MADAERPAGKVVLDETQKDAASIPSPPASPPVSLRSPTTASDYYASRPRHDKLGNPIPPRRAGAMSAVYGSGKITLPGDLGPNDPRRPRSPAPPYLPGDLGPHDPRRPRSVNTSPAPPRPSDHARKASDPLETSMPPAEADRIYKDPKEPEENRQPATESDRDADAENDTDVDESRRGRHRKRPEPGRTTSGKAVNVRSESEESMRQFPNGKPDPTKGESAISFKVTPAPGAEAREKKRVHPSTAFDHTPSGAATPLASSDDETHSELRAAQKLSLTMSAVHSTPSAHRVIRQIIRGDYTYFQREAEEGRKRQRMYLVATDISPEAEYALEWTIGTVLRDGDTLFAVYAVDEEGAGAGGEGGVEIGHGADSVRDTAATLRSLPATSLPLPPASPKVPASSPLSKTGATEPPRSRSRGVFGAAESERRKALEDVTERCIRLLRKTRLQVRVVVEVFHCKSPRHTIIEIIDFLSPTLVVIGSRGRSAVKGVLLGSFSNYLVTKSSVPVMVARKKLRKHSKTVKNRDGSVVPFTGGNWRVGRLSNVIEAPKTKGLRVQGWDKVGID